VLDEQFPEWPSLRIHELAPGGAASDRLRRRAPAYTYSYFGKPDEPFEDVEALSFDDDSIDLFITQDVFEHVVRPAQGFAEIHRVLRPGGAHVFTVPVYPRPATVVRVAEDGSHLLEPAFHEGTEGPSLVVREWGSDLPEIVDRSGLETTVHRLVDRRRGLEGEHLEVIVSRKPRSPTA
jgi:SAM-dependent methyltransferase